MTTISETEGEAPADSAVADVEDSKWDEFKPFLTARHWMNAKETPDGTEEIFAIVRTNIEPWPGGRVSSRLERFLLIGFDTEYQSIKPLYTQAEVNDKQARYEVASYQAFLKLDGAEVSGIIIPKPRRRISFVDFLTFALAKITSAGIPVPRTIVLVGHFNKADFPAFDDRDQAFKKLAAIRNSLVTLAYPIKVRIGFSDDENDFEEVDVHVRDSILMAPSGQRSLDAVGKLIGQSKIKLHDDAAIELDLKRNIISVRDNAWELFREYALKDAEISALYFERLTLLYRAVTGTMSIPTALSNIGVKLLLNEWASRFPSVDRLQLLGKEQVKEEVWNNDVGHFITYKEEPYLAEVHHHILFATECYHGGRSEQMWFGPSDVCDFSDYDLAGAYPTAMSMLKAPDWRSIRETKDINDLRLDRFAFAWVDFNFPETVRYPTLPIRTSRGILFPRQGTSYCCSPEIELAISLGAQINVRRGLVIDTSDELVFQPFIKQAIRLRTEAESDLEKSFWKEVSNACYGKTAQGLREKRVFNLKTKKTKAIPPSPITNPFFAANITSMVRAVIGEIINSIPRDKFIFSVTTDGFLTDATEEDARWAAAGPIANQFSQARMRLTANPDVLTKKHSVRRLLGWRTRGQATLEANTTVEEGKGIVLAKAGIKAPTYATRLPEQNNYIVEQFLNRIPGRKFTVDTQTTLREIMLFNADNVTKRGERAIGMEYDFKRRPAKAWDQDIQYKGKCHTHLAFSTKPWRTVEEFKTARQLWESYSYAKVKIETEVKDKAGRMKKVSKFVRRQRHCLKSAQDLGRFAMFHDTRIAVKGRNGTYMRSDQSRLRRDLCAAYHAGAAGLKGCQERYSAQDFADLLTRCGFDEPVTRSHVEYGKRRKFVPNTTPPTPSVMRILRLLSKAIPSLKPQQIIVSMEGLPLLTPALAPQ